MKAFEYLSIFILLFQVLALSEVMIGLAYAVNDIQHTNFYFIHSLYMFFGIIWVLDYVLKIRSLEKVASWTLWKLALVIIPGLVYLIMAKLLMPNIESPNHYDFENIFNRNKQFFYLLTVIYILSINLIFGLIYKIKKWKLAVYLSSPILGAIFGVFFNSVFLDYIILTIFFIATLAMVVFPTYLKDSK